MSTKKKYLTFVLNSQKYGIEIAQVREINGYIEPEHSNQHPKLFINLRGQRIPVYKSQVPVDVTDMTCVIVIETPNTHDTYVALFVDEVHEVLDASPNDITLFTIHPERTGQHDN